MNLLPVPEDAVLTHIWERMDTTERCAMCAVTDVKQEWSMFGWLEIPKHQQEAIKVGICDLLKGYYKIELEAARKAKAREDALTQKRASNQ